jgi:amino acid transporter
MVILKHCCCCATLAVGGVIIGWVNLVFALIEIIGIAISISDLESAKKTLIEMDQNNREVAELISSFGMLLLSIMMVIKIIGFIVAILLILGATKRNRFHILPHLIFESVYIVLIGIVWIILFIAIFSASGIFVLLILWTLFFAFNVYLWLCVLSLYQEIRDDETRPPPDSYLMRPAGPHNQIQQKPPAYPNQQNLL